MQETCLTASTVRLVSMIIEIYDQNNPSPVLRLRDSGLDIPVTVGPRDPGLSRVTEVLERPWPGESSWPSGFKAWRGTNVVISRFLCLVGPEKRPFSWRHFACLGG
ncbi:hypothetical protein FOQG_06584 [Fusarium oxysporum f. sp. raphani 54005]|uniref:Uncharacterized protein n=4 Tax=Fusarium oxysporum species complex TaxID=171631 RepID=X0CJR0_FUSOX|nr:uncharacterized protein FOIG_07098 [Fusarium odoratissimum NRRL 54006]EXA45122.1 hypothetical protein FOVG_06296 [Fusarium oxysporum f. sp. pisi HDV247]EXK91074.1 hypothetical protein FOQG_06584 [Fusarium oxysporum f. sp. raphani 54005]EXL84752.1 hypothetical protein FOPG_03225 [Fusarium oxysporum f. sp. conglutinans race 2 54008]KAJ0136690.1 Uncharacterized protein HZ326_20313 [Fusarium oxysporum f. sp. albedinis]EXM01501.1 hypothetical protein FOIG_07098 [Fusarium odoratissimum NRRL 54006